MIKGMLIAISLLLASTVAVAEVRPFINADVGYADTDYYNGAYYDIGAGVQFNEYIEFEVDYNNYGDVGPYEIEITSFSYGLNLGANVSENTRLFVVVGAERLEADETVSLGMFSVSVDESSTEAFFGIGAAFKQNENVEIRTKLISHDSGDLVTLNIGAAFYF